MYTYVYTELKVEPDEYVSRKYHTYERKQRFTMYIPTIYQLKKQMTDIYI